MRWNAATRVGMLFVLLTCAGNATAENSREKLRLWPDNLFGVSFPSPDTGFVSGYAGTLLRTIDGGQTWSWSNVGINELLRRIAFVSDKRGWAIGHRGTILRTTDGGTSWDVQARQTGIYLRDVRFADDDHGWVVGHDATILRTRDGGESWQAQGLTGFKGRDMPRLHAISTIDTTRAMLVGEFGVAAYTADGGETWRVFDTGIKKTLLALTHLGDGAFLAGGLDGTLVRLEPSKVKESAPMTEDAPPGVPYTVSTIDSGTTEHYFDVSAVGDGRAVAVGRAILSMIGTDGEVTPIGVDDTLQLAFTWFGGADVADNGQLWLVGIRGIIAGGSIGDGRSISRRASLGHSESIGFVNRKPASSERQP